MKLGYKQVSPIFNLCTGVETITKGSEMAIEDSLELPNLVSKLADEYFIRSYLQVCSHYCRV